MKYTIKLLPVDKEKCIDEIDLKDFIFNEKSHEIATCLGIDYEAKVLQTDLNEFHPIAEWVKMKKYLCSQKDIVQNDIVAVVYTNGFIELNEFTVGALTKIWDVEDGPYCQIDGKLIDLASEGHSSNVYKIICQVEDWVVPEMKLDESEVKIIQEQDGVRCEIKCPHCKHFH